MLLSAGRPMSRSTGGGWSSSGRAPGAGTSPPSSMTCSPASVSSSTGTGVRELVEARRRFSCRSVKCIGLLMHGFRSFGYGHSFGVLSHYYGREAGLELREDIDTVVRPGMVISMEPMITIPEGQPGAGGYR